MNKKALSPLVATVLLVAFSLVIGTITMNWGKSYIDTAEAAAETEKLQTGAVVINIEDIDSDLKRLQLQFISGKLTQEEYLQKEKEIIS